MTPQAISGSSSLHSEIHVWAIRTVAPDEVVADFARTLAPDQRERASRFHFDDLRRTYVLAAGGLRFLLGSYLGVAPDAIVFAYGERGKPFLCDGGPALQFNMSHSGELACFAFTSDTELGVDIEKIRPVHNMLSIASLYFCAAESETLRSLDAAQSTAAFFNCWTRKEAYVKAIGSGLYTPLDRVQVTMLPDQVPAFLHIAGDTESAAEWSLHDLQICEGYAAALAHRGRATHVRISPVLDPAELIRHQLPALSHG